MICGASCGKYQLRYPLVDFAAPPIGRTPDATGGISGEFPANGTQRKAGMAGCGSSLPRTGLWGLNSLLTGKSTANSGEIRHQNLFELSQPSEVAALSAKHPLQGTRNSYRANSEYLEVKHGIGRHRSATQR
jgi:hypothetical protein